MITYLTLLSVARYRLWLRELCAPKGMNPIGILLKAS